MRLSGISSVRRRACKATTNSNRNHPIAPNLLMRNFTFEHPDQAWVGDITYIPTGEGWLYLVIVKDLCTRKIAGYAFSNCIDTQLTLAGSGYGVPPPQLIFRPGRAVHRQSLPGTVRGIWHPPEYVPQGRPIRQRRGRKFLQLPQMRTDPPQAVSHRSSGAERCVFLFRDFLQHGTPSFRLRMALACTL